MNKKEMIRKVAEKNNMTKVQTEAVINTFLEEIEECVASGDKITLLASAHSHLSREQHELLPICIPMKRLKFRKRLFRSSMLGLFSRKRLHLTTPNHNCIKKITK